MSHTGDIVVVYTTCETREQALHIANTLVEQQVAACVNILPGILPVYSWKGERQQGNEQLLLIKTAATRYQALEQAIIACHPYEVPEIIALPVMAGSLPSPGRVASPPSLAGQ